MTPGRNAVPSIATPGSPAYWTEQREAFALVRAWELTAEDPYAELAALRRIAAHGFAARVMAAHGRDVARWIAFLEDLTAANDAGDDPDEPPAGDDWCPRGCQPLHRLGECGMCGFQGRGVRIDASDSVAEYCCCCRARTYQNRDGICYACGKDAEGDREAATESIMCPRGCQPVAPDGEYGMCSYLQSHAQLAAAERVEAHRGEVT